MSGVSVEPHPLDDIVFVATPWLQPVLIWVGLCFSFNIPGAPDCQAQLAFFLGLKPLGTCGPGLKYDPTDKENISLYTIPRRLH